MTFFWKTSQDENDILFINLEEINMKSFVCTLLMRLVFVSLLGFTVQQVNAMSVTYEGTVFEITSSLQQVVLTLSAGNDLSNIANSINYGVVEVRPLSIETDVIDGDFSVTVSDNPNILHGYRFLTFLRDPCLSIHDEINDLERELGTAQRDGSSARRLNFIRGEITRKQNELEICIQQHQNAGVNFNSPVPVHRSMDLFRTSVDDSSIRDIRIFYRILDEDDFDWARNQGYEIPNILTYEDLLDKAQAATADTQVSVTDITLEEGNIRVDVNMEIEWGPFSYNVGGNILLEIEPSDSYNFRHLIRLELIDFSFPLDSIFNFLFPRIEQGVENAIKLLNTGINQELTDSIQNLFDEGITVTLLEVAEEVDGVHLSMAWGLIQGMPNDPCQSIRNEIIQLENELAALQSEGDLQNVEDNIVGEILQKQSELDSCRNLTRMDVIFNFNQFSNR